MKTESGIIIRYANAMPAFFSFAQFHAAHLVGRAFSNELKDVATSVDIGKCVYTVHTGVSTYDKRINSAAMTFLTGNVVSDFQFSLHVRAATDVKCNGFTFSPGHLRESDFKRLQRYGDIFRQWHAQNLSRFGDVETICYVIRDGRGEKSVDRGWLITNTRGNLLAVKTLGTSPRARKFNSMIMTEATRLLTMQHLVVDVELAIRDASNGNVVVKDTDFMAKLKNLFPSVPWTPAPLVW